MKLGPQGSALIKSYETCALRAYLPTPEDKWTCGWGSTRGVDENTVWTQEQADARFLEDIAWVEECVNRVIKVPLTQQEFDALCSLCFNIGCSAFSGSTLAKRLNDSDYDAARGQFRVWNKQNHKELAGLTKRRAAEAELFEETA